MAKLKDEYEHVNASYEKAENELQSEFELRNAAQAHVRSLQKSMMDMDSGASSVKQQLLDARNQLEQLRRSYEERIQKETQSRESQISKLQEQHDSQLQAIQSLNQACCTPRSRNKDM